MSKLYLVPNILSKEGKADSMAPSIAAAIAHVRLFLVEEPKAARALLKMLKSDFPLSECTFLELSEHTAPQQITEYMTQADKQDMAIISEAGYPCVADPGAELVRLAHQKGVEIIPLVGASSIILALASSGLSGQNFAFNGYLPKDKQERLSRIKALEQRSGKEKQTQIFMEAPYRSQALLEDILNTCDPKTLLCVAVDLTGPSQMIKTAKIADWKKKSPFLDKNPTLFLINLSEV